MVTSRRTMTPARYRARISQLRRASLIVLIVGTAAAAACAFGPLWLVRLGLIPAVVAAVVSCLLAWREIGLERRAHASAMLDASRRHGVQLSEERRHNAAVVQAMTRRLDASNTLARSRAASIARLDGDAQRLRGDVAGLRGANSRLTRDLNCRDVTIRDLRRTVAERDATIETLTARDVGAAVDGRSDGEVHAFPRRTLRDAPEAGPTAGSAARRDADFLAAEAGIIMPNYEEDRRLG